MAVATGGARRRRHHARTSRCTAPAHAKFYGRRFKCWKKGGHGTIDLRHAIEQSCNVYFYTVGNMVGIDKIHKWATLLGLGVKSGIDLPNEVQGLVPSHRVEARDAAREVVRRRDDLGVDRPGRGVGDAGVDGGLHGDARQRRHARHAAPAQGGGRWHRLEAGAAAGAAVAGRHRMPEKLQAIRDGLWMVVNGAGTGGRARIDGYDVSRQDRHGAGDFERRASRRRGQDRQGSARQRLVRVLRAARQPADRRRRLSSSTACTAANAALDRASRARHVLREEGRAAAAADTAGRLKPSRCRTSRLDAAATPRAARADAAEPEH